ncbi:reverse transcriptase [Tanacetum coccineum]
MNYHGNPLLSSIWKFKVPPKARLLCWQVLSSKLPTRDLLSRIGVISENHIECSLCCSGDVSKDQRPSQWCLPDDVNVDGLAKGKPGLAYIGGLLRNTEGVVVALFSVPVGVMDSNVVKVLAMKDACKMLNKKVELNSVKVVIESDYLNAVSWAHTPIMRPWRFLPYFYEVDIFFSSSSSHSIVHVDRECNSNADKLAKDMVYRTSPLSIWKND